jgi:hypothetical protein
VENIKTHHIDIVLIVRAACYSAARSLMSQFLPTQSNVLGLKLNRHLPASSTRPSQESRDALNKPERRTAIEGNEVPSEIHWSHTLILKFILGLDCSLGFSFFFTPAPRGSAYQTSRPFACRAPRHPVLLFLAPRSLPIKRPGRFAFLRGSIRFPP